MGFRATLNFRKFNAAFDPAFAKFVGDMKSSILEKTYQTLENAVQVLMKDCVTDLTIVVIEFTKDLSDLQNSHLQNSEVCCFS